MLNRLLAFLILGFLLGGCASPPSRELNIARKAVARAYAAGAPRLAPTEYRAAAETLRESEDLVGNGKYALAREILPFASAHAESALLLTRQKRADLELQRVRRHQQIIAEKVEAARRKPTLPTKKALTPPPPPPKPEPPATSGSPAKPKPAPLPKPERYMVRGGETLWTIAARLEIYRDALLWPLIYQANRDQIKDPRQIYPDQILTIPRLVDEREKEEAREKARRSEIFPVGELMSESDEGEK